MQKVQKTTANRGVDVLRYTTKYSDAFTSGHTSLGTPYCRSRKFSRSALGLKDQDINTIITERHQELDVISHETLDLAHTVMDKTKDLGHQLAKKHDKIIESANLNKGLRSALERFPTKVLSKIFDYYLMDSNYLSRRSNPSPMQLARVCHRWRDVAERMANLWCKLSFDVGDDRTEWKRSIFYYDSWLKRSQDYPLSLQLRPGYAKGGTAKLRQLLQPCMSRVSSLDIVFWDDVEPEHLLEDLPAGLQELTVCFGDWFDASAIAQSLSQLPSTVRSLKIIDRIFGPDCLHSLNPVWAHLTHVEIAIRPRNVFHFLFLCPNLSSCELIFSQPVSMDTRVQCMRFTHANLRSLCIICPGRFESNPLPILFRALILPKLRTLEIRYGFLSSPHEELLTFLRRSKCPLEILIFDAVVIPPPEQQGDFIAIIPTLKIECKLDIDTN
ncbi:uncharacterized protein F5147DRAFT_839604 [Suillus discolor]|uniref:F-box domain-containing protein n=1 Tax=Suillus discolor TaxID=1912936 RepID=A0A9P7JQB4_9AGAM|nr:uncharacterized protein F5147DRAFT_839604 [Suillus discolor]KAG2098384.1 hypothetical protein F5147DRAFT_839604 [Suillus discolor]